MRAKPNWLSSTTFSFSTGAIPANSWLGKQGWKEKMPVLDLSQLRYEMLSLW